MERLSRPGFKVVFYDTLEDFYLAEALEYIDGLAAEHRRTTRWAFAVRSARPSNCRWWRASSTRSAWMSAPAHFWGMDEWFLDGNGGAGDASAVLRARRPRALFQPHRRRSSACRTRTCIFPRPTLRPTGESWDAGVRCAVMQGGQGDVKHWAFNDPLPRAGANTRTSRRSPAEYRKLATRVVDLHPLTVAQNARTSGGGNISLVPTQAISVGPVETWKAEKVSIWQAGNHDNPFGQRLTAFMISKRMVDTAVPMSLLAEHPERAVQLLPRRDRDLRGGDALDGWTAFANWWTWFLRLFAWGWWQSIVLNWISPLRLRWIQGKLDFPLTTSF